MKTLSVLFLVVTLLWASPAVAEMQSLSNDQMDHLTAGAASRRSANFNTSQGFEGEVDNTWNAQSLEAMNAVNTPSTTGNSSENENGTNHTQVGGRAQDEARSVSIVNGNRNNAHSVYNAYAEIERPPGVTMTSPPDLSGSNSRSTISSMPYFNQSNIIVPH